VIYVRSLHLNSFPQHVVASFIFCSHAYLPVWNAKSSQLLAWRSIKWISWGISRRSALKIIENKYASFMEKMIHWYLLSMLKGYMPRSMAQKNWSCLMEPITAQGQIASSTSASNSLSKAWKQNRAVFLPTWT